MSDILENYQSPTMIYYEDIARHFHETYERYAPKYNYTTSPETAVPWQNVPENNKKLMIAVAAHMADYILRPGATDLVEIDL